MKVLVIDCFDSFTYNLVQQLGSLGGEPIVVTSDTPIREVTAIPCERIILSPGPGTPEDAGVCLEVLVTMSRYIPTLGVCLGHQAICVAYGGKVTRAQYPVHGKTSLIRHDGRGVFEGVKNPFCATRYHSLVADPTALPSDLVVTAVSSDDSAVMGVRHTSYPIEGVQFHPESVLTSAGDRILENFLALGRIGCT
jgi:anthranilate synthase/aminodeoxychorismate synthase-like glutamine amidotransferase